ncbi:dentin sialophosphoprotein isoform X3 [Hydra vulgaris]|uniref:Dentin sialophosphoprotein isoform X3 n=1 Tax=Hydra vulgaris TaxID=6087 RepID=A0ABM4BIV8_HYDVU
MSQLIMAESSWSASTLRRSSFLKILTTDELRFPNTLSKEDLVSHLKDRNIIKDEILERSTLVSLFKKHISPLPQRENINRIQNISQGVSFHETSRLQKKPKMEIESDNDSGGSSIITDETRPKSNALTVKIPAVSKGELRGSKPVKLKRKKSSDKVSEQAYKKSSKNEESSFYDHDKEIQSSTASNQQQFSGIRQNLTSKSTGEQIINKDNSFTQEVSRKFTLTANKEDTRKIQKRNVECESKDFSESIEIIDDDNDDDIKQANEKLAIIDENPETIQVSVGRDKNRSAVVLSKDESRKMKNSSSREFVDSADDGGNDAQNDVFKSYTSQDRVLNDQERHFSKDDTARSRDSNVRKQRHLSKSPQRRSPRRISPRQRRSRSPRNRYVQDNYRPTWQQHGRPIRREVGRFNNNTRYGRGHFHQNRFQHSQRRFSPPRTRWIPDRRNDRGNIQGSRFSTAYRRSNSVERARLAERKRMDEEKLREKESTNAQRKRMEEELREIESKIETKKKSKLKRQENKIDSLDVNVAIHSINAPDKKEMSSENVSTKTQEKKFNDSKQSSLDSSLGIYEASTVTDCHEDIAEQQKENFARVPYISSDKRDRPISELRHTITEKYHDTPHIKIEPSHSDHILLTKENIDIKNQVLTSDDSDAKSEDTSKKSELNETEKSEEGETDLSDSSDDSSSTDESDSLKKKKKRSKKKKSKKHYSSSSDSDSTDIDSDSSDDSIKKKKKKKRKIKKKSLKKLKNLKRKVKKERKGALNEDELKVWFEEQKAKLCDELREQLKKELISSNVNKSDVVSDEQNVKDTEIHDEFDEDNQIAGVSGILSKDPSAIALQDDEIDTPPCEEEVFNVFKSDDDLELDSEDDNWKRHGIRDSEGRKSSRGTRDKHRSNKSQQKSQGDSNDKVHSTSDGKDEILNQQQVSKGERELNFEKSIVSHTSRKKNDENRKKNRFDQRDTQDSNKTTLISQKEFYFEKKDSIEVDHKRKGVSRENHSENTLRTLQRESIFEKPRDSRFDKEVKSTSRSKSFHSAENIQYDEPGQSIEASDAFFSKSFSQVDDTSNEVAMASKVRASGFSGFLSFPKESRKSCKPGLEDIQVAESSGHWEAPFSTTPVRSQKVIASPMSDGSRRKSYEKAGEKQTLIEQSEDHGILRSRQVDEKTKKTSGKYGSNTEKRDLHQKNRDDYQRVDVHHQEKIDSRRQRTDEKHERENKYREGGNQLRNNEIERYRSDNQEIIHRDSNKDRNFESNRNNKNNFRSMYYNRNVYDGSKQHKSNYDHSFSENVNYSKSGRANVYVEKNNENRNRSSVFAEEMHDNRKRLNDFHGGINDNVDSKLKKRDNALSSNSGDSGEYSSNNPLNYTKPQKHYRGKRK